MTRHLSQPLAKPRAIIIGGGPVGLMAALGLARAGIDFRLLERRESVVANEGSDMTLLPPTMKMLDQMDVLEPLLAAGNEVTKIERIDHQGQGMGTMGIFESIKDSTGHYPSVISRRNLLKNLYKGLPSAAKDKILTNKKVQDIQSTPDGVRVTCTDGQAHEGTFVIGADGVHSAVRKTMRKLAIASSKSSEANAADPFLTTFQAMWIRFPTSVWRGAKPGMAIETHGSGMATQMFAGGETATVGVYRTLPEPIKRGPRYAEKDELALIDEWGDLPLTEGGDLRLKDVYHAREDAGLVNLEEGVLPHWSWGGRIVLAGDAAHKFTPSMGSGMNTGLLDTVVLINEIHKLSHAHSDSSYKWWDSDALSQAFHRYQEKRMEEVQAGCKESGNATTMATWANTGVRLTDQYLIPNRFFQWALGYMVAQKVKKATPIVFSFE